MTDKSKSMELQVGVFVFAGLIVLAWFVWKIGDIKMVRESYDVKVTFGFANGVKLGAPVRVAGVDKGEVKDIVLSTDVQGKPLVTVTVWVDGDTTIPKDSRAWVNTLGLLGEKYLEIIPGQDYRNKMLHGDILKGEDPVSIQEITNLTKDVTLQAKDAIASLQKTLENIDLVLKDVHSGSGTVGKLFNDSALYDHLEEMFADLKDNPWKLLYRPKSVR